MLVSRVIRILNFGLPLLLLVLAWELSSRLNLINAILLPPPSTIIATFYNLLLPDDTGHSALAAPENNSVAAAALKTNDFMYFINSLPVFENDLKKFFLTPDLI